MTIPYKVSWRKRLLLFEPYRIKLLRLEEIYADSLQALKISNAENTTRDMNVVTECDVVLHGRRTTTHAYAAAPKLSFEVFPLSNWSHKFQAIKGT